MDWETLQRLRRDVVVPELNAWIDGDASPTQGVNEHENTPLWMIEAMITSACSIHSAVTSSRTDMFRMEGWDRSGVIAMSLVLSAKHGVFDGSSLDHQHIRFLASLESLLRPLGPFDSIDGTGPGRAISVMRDGLGRLHNPAGPALEFKDRGLHCLHGIWIDRDAWRTRDDAQAILKVVNLEMRRALVERMGVREWIVAVGMKPVHADRFGTLYRMSGLRMGSRDDIGYVHVVCPSTAQDYFIAVPGNCRTAHEAVAWTFSMVPEDYNPTQEA